LRGNDINRKREISVELADLEKMEESSPLSATNNTRRATIQQELLTTLDNGEFLASEINRGLVLRGDSNTAYFHRIFNGCKRGKELCSF
jgi:hypothetical protein